MKLPDIFLPTTAVVLADGAYPSAAPVAGILRAAPWVVCCDGAADKFISRGGTPAAIVGDCDSVSAQVRERYASLIHASPDQQSNDLTKAVGFCLANGRKDIVILGATGLREDHTIGNISLLADYTEQAEVMMVTDYGVFTPMQGRQRLKSFPGQQVSVFALDPNAELWYEGLLYELPGSKATSWWQGTLNQSLGDSFVIHSEGKAIVFRSFEK